MTRNALARWVAVLGGVLLLACLWLALGGQGSRLDVFLLVIAAITHFVGVILWWAVPRAPKWLVAGYGLVLAASGLGFFIAAPADVGATLTFYGMGGAGLLTIVAAAIHR